MKDSEKISSINKMLLLFLFILLFYILWSLIFPGGESTKENVNDVKEIKITSEEKAMKQSDNFNSRFYLQRESNIRKCESLKCESLGSFPVNTEFVLPYNSDKELPEWVLINFTDEKNNQQIGYIDKLYLSTKPIDKGIEKYVSSGLILDNQLKNIGKGGCKAEAEVELNKAWIRSCNLLGKLSYNCQQLFFEGGGYKYYPEINDPNWESKFNQMKNDLSVCSCLLPSNIGNQINKTFEYKKNQCDMEWQGN